MSYYRPVTPPRLHGSLLLASRQVCAKLAERHPDQVRRHCHPVACDVTSRQPLYDADDCCNRLRKLRRAA